MTLHEIKQALDQGHKVCWSNQAYEVIKDKRDQYLIVCNLNKDAVGLTWLDGVTMNGKPEDFFIIK